MNKDIMRLAGFEKEVKLVENNKCPFCGHLVIRTDFEDKLSIREFEISGLCQYCQDNTFNPEEIDND